jgi:hypothetical protein
MLLVFHRAGAGGLNSILEGDLMPLYVYRCSSCKETIEEFRSVEMRNGGIHICDPIVYGTELYTKTCRNGFLDRIFTPVASASIPGIPNQVNRHMDESSSKPMRIR